MLARTVFFGTPAFAVPSLQALAEVTEVVGVVCQPDRPSGRGMKLKFPAVKEAALALGLPVYQPTRVRDGALQQWLEQRRVKAALVVAYGRILPPDVLATPARGCFNLHGSVLPRHRGAAPIQTAILRGDSSTGISLMQMDQGMDTGPVYRSRSIPIGAEATGGSLTEELAQLAAAMVKAEFIEVLQSGESPQAQQSAQATEAPPFHSADFVIDWTRSAAEVSNHIRAFAPTPGAFSFLGATRVKVLKARPIEVAAGTPGTIHLDGGRIEVSCGRDGVAIEVAQLSGKKSQTARDLINGRALRDGQCLGPSSAS